MNDRFHKSGGTLPLPGFISDEEAFPPAEDDLSDNGGDVGEGDEPAADIDAPEDGESIQKEEPFERLEQEALHWSSEKTARVLESLLFVADKPLTDEAIRRCTGLSVHAVREALADLAAFYDDSCRGIVLSEVAGGWQLRTNPEAAPVVRRLLKVKPQRLTRAALETLAIVAYRQPVTRPEVEDVRAVDSGAVLKALLERRLIRILGKRDEPGRPLIYGTTREFLEFFGLKDLSCLPTLREFQELSRESEEVVEKELGADAKKGILDVVSDLRDHAFEEKLKAGVQEADEALADLEGALADSEEATRHARELLADPEDEAGTGRGKAGVPDPDGGDGES